MLDLALHYGVLLSWGLALFYFGRFAREWWRSEQERGAALLALAAVALPAAALAFLLPARGGYDNDHDFSCLGTFFFSARPHVSGLFKEYAPLFTDGVTDFLSGYSLRAVLWKNRLLPLLSAFAVFAGLRRLGAGLAAAAGGTALLALNFLAPLNASAFSTTSANLFIWALSLLALFDAHAAPALTAGRLAWLLSTSVLVISSRFEFLPANLLILAAVLAAKPAAERRALFKPARLALLLAGGALLAAWGARALAAAPERQLQEVLSPAKNLVSQLGTRNLAVIAGERPTPAAFHGERGNSPASTAALLLPALLLLFSLAGALFDGEKRRRNLGFAAVLLAWALYFSFIYGPPDLYPLHFMRHQLYFLVPFALLFALGLDGFEGAARRWPALRRAGPFAVAVFVCVYGALNARAALALNQELRTNDRELAFLAEARRDWPAGCLAVYPKYSRKSTRADFLAKYFPALPERGPLAGACLLKYVSPEPLIFTDPEPAGLAQPPLGAGAAEPWRKVTFHHAFYTAFRAAGPGGGNRTETAAPLQVTAGFFKLGAAPDDRAFLLAAEGARAFSACDREAAVLILRDAVEADPSRLNARYLLAAAETATGGRKEAGAALKALEKAAPGAVTPAHRRLLEALAAGDSSAAEAAVSEIETADPYFALGANLKAGLRCR